MKIEIWSDVVCPFCYIGKRELEKALAQFPDREKIEIEWKSFELAPDVEYDPKKSVYQYLAEKYGYSLEQSKASHDQLAARAKGLGLEYNFDKAVMANTMLAHQLLHFAKEQGKQNEAEELLFRAYFTEGKNLEDIPTLVKIGVTLGFDAAALKSALENGDYVNQVNLDIAESRQIGVRGVPFFLFDGKYVVSGAQEHDTFLGALEQSFGEWQAENPEKAREEK